MISKHVLFLKTGAPQDPALETSVHANSTSGYLGTCSLDRSICHCREMKHRASRCHMASAGQRGTRRKRKNVTNNEQEERQSH